jgi:hypothetical protein
MKFWHVKLSDDTGHSWYVTQLRMRPISSKSQNVTGVSISTDSLFMWKAKLLLKYIKQQFHALFQR